MNIRIATLIAAAAFASGVAVSGGAPALADDPDAANLTAVPRAAAVAAPGAWDPAAMDEMHSAMAAQMPVEMRAACDEMHQAMAGRMAGMNGMHGAHHGGQPDV